MVVTGAAAPAAEPQLFHKAGVPALFVNSLV
jgi:hypothetical protein